MRTLILTKDKSAFRCPIGTNEFDDWSKDNLYSYQITISENRKSNLKGIMQQDLNRYFGIEKRIEAKMEIRKISIW